MLKCIEIYHILVCCLSEAFEAKVSNRLYNSVSGVSNRRNSLDSFFEGRLGRVYI